MSLCFIVSISSLTNLAPSNRFRCIDEIMKNDSSDELYFSRDSMQWFLTFWTTASSSWPLGRDFLFFVSKLMKTVRFLFKYVYLNLKIANKWHFCRQKEIIRMKMDIFVMKTSNLYSKGVNKRSIFESVWNQKILFRAICIHKWSNSI